LVPLSESLSITLLVEATFAGVGLHVRDLAAGMARRGHRVTLLWSPARADRPFLEFVSEPPAGVSPRQILLRRQVGPGDFGAARRVRALLSDDVDVVHGHSSKGGAIARLAAAGTGIPSIATPNALITSDPTLSAPARVAYGTVERALGLIGQAVIAVSPEEVDELRRIGVPGSRIHLIPNGVAPLDAADRTPARAQLCLRPDDRVVGFVGRLVPQKDPELLVRAFAAIPLADARLVLIGDGALRPQVESLVERLGLGERVTLLGEVPARRLLPAFDVLALASRYEGHPHVVIEALSAGVPVVSTRTGGISELLGSGAGLIVPVGDERSLAAALTRMLTDAEQAAAAAAEGRRRAKAFDVDTMIAATEQLYRSLADRRRRR
jgi:glycosyltransferase involved in cell wall biosynthesis